MQAHAPEQLTDKVDRTMTAPDSTGVLATQQRLVAALRQAATTAAGAERVGLIETHISFVLLAGGFAYKIKKAVGLPFLDFRTLAARRFYCEEELRLNRKYAPGLYLDVVAITGKIETPVLGGDGAAIEYAVKMREFPQLALASEALTRGELTAADIDALAGMVATAHAAAGVAPRGGKFGAPDQVLAIASRNFAEIRPLLAGVAELADLDALLRWTSVEHASRAPAMAQRRDLGFVRECHGDLHLGNIARVDGALTLFDCIEFNEEMRWIDVMSEIAFTTMDLRDRGHPDFSHRFLNRYLETTGDYDGLAVLRFYLVYRAMVRAKIARLRARQLEAGDTRSAALAEYRSYLRLATSYAAPPRPAIVITHGLSGSGKTSLTQGLLEQAGAVRIRTDVERARRSGREQDARGTIGIDAGAYTPEATRETYARVQALARSAIESGFAVIVDGAFLKTWQRHAFRDLATALAVPFVIVSFVASVATLRERISRRMRDGTDASEADLKVLEHQLRTQEPLDADEEAHAVGCDTEAPLDAAFGNARWKVVLDRMGAGTDGHLE